MGQLLTRNNICSHRVQEHHPIQAGAAVHSGKPLCYPATSRIATNPSLNSSRPWTSRSVSMRISDKRMLQRSTFCNQVSKPSTRAARNHPAAAPRLVGAARQHRAAISQGRRLTVLQLDALDPQLTKTGLWGQSCCLSRQQPLLRWQRKPQHPSGP